MSTAVLVARYWVALTDANVELRTNGTISQTSARPAGPLEAELRNRLGTLIAKTATTPDWASIIPVLELINKARGADFGPRTWKQIEAALLAQLKDHTETIPQLMRACAEMRNCDKLKDALLTEIVRMTDVPSVGL